MTLISVRITYLNASNHVDLPPVCACIDIVTLEHACFPIVYGTTSEQKIVCRLCMYVYLVHTFGLSSSHAVFPGLMGTRRTLRFVIPIGYRN